MKKLVFLITALFAAVLFGSCYEPSPLYGKWADNYGNQISFISDGTFVAKIYTDETNSKTYQGDYSVVDNVLVFTESDGTSINTEWDLRGAMLYLTWTISGDEKPKNLTLYHVSK